MNLIKSITFFVIMVLLLIFVIQNGGVLSSPVSFEMDLFVKDFSTGPVPLYSVLLVAFCSGLLISGLWGLVHRWRLRSQNRQMNRLLAERERELNSLRNLPVLEAQGLGTGEALSERQGGN